MHRNRYLLGAAAYPDRDRSGPTLRCRRGKGQGFRHGKFPRETRALDHPSANTASQKNVYVELAAAESVDADVSRFAQLYLDLARSKGARGSRSAAAAEVEAMVAREEEKRRGETQEAPADGMSLLGALYALHGLAAFNGWADGGMAAAATLCKKAYAEKR